MMVLHIITFASHICILDLLQLFISDIYLFLLQIDQLKTIIKMII